MGSGSVALRMGPCWWLWHEGEGVAVDGKGRLGTRQVDQVAMKGLGGLLGRITRTRLGRWDARATDLQRPCWTGGDNELRRTLLPTEYAGGVDAVIAVPTNPNVHQATSAVPEEDWSLLTLEGWASGYHAVAGFSSLYGSRWPRGTNNPCLLRDRGCPRGDDTHPGLCDNPRVQGLDAMTLLYSIVPLHCGRPRGSLGQGKDLQ
jgi:hypothetical protein